MNRLETSALLFAGIAIAPLFLMPSTISAAEPAITDSIAPADDLNLPFGALAIGGSTPEQTLTLTNTGTSPLTLPPFTLTGSGAAAFELNVNGGTVPCGVSPALVPGERCTVTLSFQPDIVGARTAFLNIGPEEQIAFHDPVTKGISLFGLISKTLSPVTTPATGIIDDYPTWSPDRSQIAFHREASGTDRIYSINVDGMGITPVADTATEPDWSPDGQKIAMRDTQLGGLKVYHLNLNQLSAVVGSSAGGESHNPHWSPDSQKLVFHLASTLGNFPNEIFTMNEDGSAFLKIVANNGKSPAWSPDGQNIAFHNISTQGLSLVRVSPSVGAPTSLTTPASAKDSFPTWSPDGGSLVFQRSTSGPPAQDQLMKMAVNGSPVPLTLVSGGNVLGKTPAWSHSTQTPVALIGTALDPTGANQAPTAPQLLSPANHQTGVGTNVTLKWSPASDPDGDALSYALLLCEADQIQAPDCVPTPLSKTRQASSSFSGIGFTGSGMLVFGLLFGTRRARHRITKTGRSLFFLFALMFIAGGCGGGGGDSAPVGEHTQTLKANTSYLWQVTAKDGKGGEAASVVWCFTT